MSLIHICLVEGEIVLASSCLYFSSVQSKYQST